MSDGFWRGVFLSSAILNWIVGLSLLVDVTDVAASMGVEMLRFDTLYSPLAGWFVIVFGVLYFAVSRDLAGTRAVVLVSLIGKLGVVALIWAAWLRGEAPTAMVGLTVIDLIYSALFAAFLITRPAAGSRS